jgi:hypothetical protein
VENSKYLQHYGILGMRWGHRRASSSVSATPRQHSGSNSDDHEKMRKLKTKRISEMSNAELKEFTTRLNLEKQYRDLNKVEQSKGMAVVKEILGNAAKQTAQTYTTKYMGKMVEKLIEQASKSKGA